MIDEEKLENEINNLSKETISKLKDLFIDLNLSDREATLSLMYFIEVFIKIAWLEENPIKVLENVIQVMKEKEE